MFDYSSVRGFNYQPSFGTTSLENWLYYDKELAEKELRRGKEYFPKFNTVRYWLSWDAYRRDSKSFMEKLEQALQVADRLGLRVIACLFNRWHDGSGYDCGGVCYDNLMPGTKNNYRAYYREYVADIVKTYAADPRILVWDLCNEPYWFNGTGISEYFRPFADLETEWLTEIRNVVRTYDKVTDIGISIHAGHGREGIEIVEPLCDVLLVHPYFEETKKDRIADPVLRARYDDKVKLYYEFAKEVKKPVLITETCWGAHNDEDRVENMKFTLDTVTKYGIGFVAHALHYSRVADLHYEEDGLVGKPGNLAFTNKDGSLRKGHEVFNLY